MNEENQVVTVDDSMLDAAWDDDFTFGEGTTEANGEEAGANQTDSQDTGDNQDEAAEEAEQVETPEQEETAKPDTGVFSLKYMDESKEYKREEVVALAQKGLDYDRIRAERDSIKAERNAAKDRENFLQELADDAGMTIDEMIDGVRANRLLKRETDAGRPMTELAAKEQIQREKTARTAAAEAEAKEKEPERKEADEPHATNSTPDAVKRFVAAYPNVQAKDIPQSVWDDVRNGADLISAYTKYENAQLRSQIEAMQQNEKNKNRSTGSRQGSGSANQKTDFDAAWDASDY